jgi:hypothetical protein
VTRLLIHQLPFTACACCQAQEPVCEHGRLTSRITYAVSRLVAVPAATATAAAAGAAVLLAGAGSAVLHYAESAHSMQGHVCQQQSGITNINRST